MPPSFFRLRQRIRLDKRFFLCYYFVYELFVYKLFAYEGTEGLWTNETKILWTNETKI